MIDLTGVDHQNLIKVIFKESGIVAEDIPVEMIDKWWPDFDSKLEKFYGNYNATLYEEFTIEYEEGFWQCGLGFTIDNENFDPDDEDSYEEEYLYGTINWSVDSNFNITELDWYTD